MTGVVSLRILTEIWVSMNTFEMIFTTLALYGAILLSELVAAKLDVPRWIVLFFAIFALVWISSKLSKSMTSRRERKTGQV